MGSTNSRCTVSDTEQAAGAAKKEYKWYDFHTLTSQCSIPGEFGYAMKEVLNIPLIVCLSLIGIIILYGIFRLTQRQSTY